MKNLKPKSFVIMAILFVLIFVFSGCGDSEGDDHTHVWQWAETSDGIETGTCPDCGETTMRLTLDIGDTGPGGGIIFYRSKAGFTVQGYTGTTGSFDEYQAHYLEAAPVDEGSAYWGWSVHYLYVSITTIKNEDRDKEAIIGNGRKDTQIIANYLNDNTTETGRAAQLCSSVLHGGKNDWFIPSFGELNELCKIRGQYGIPATGLYWSSSWGGSATTVWCYNFADGDKSFVNATTVSPLNVRAIRAF